LAASASRAGTAWTDDSTARQERGLKRRADNETRTMPIPPELVRLLRAHIKRYGTTPDGRILQTARGGILQDSGSLPAWAAEVRRYVGLLACSLRTDRSNGTVPMPRRNREPRQRVSLPGC
jgi:hypothetical protein